MIWLLRFLGILKTALTACLSFARAYPWQAAVVALCALSGWLWWGKNSALDEIAAIHAAQKEATAAQVVVNRFPVLASKAIAERSNNEAPAYYERVRVVARDHVVRSPCAPIAADLPGTDSPAPLDDGPADPPGMVSLAPGDYEKLVNAAARAAQMHQDAQALIAEGVAVASDDTSLPAPAF